MNQELQTFLDFAGETGVSHKAAFVGPHILNLKSKNENAVTLGFLAIVHGNEGVGIPILNDLIRGVLSGTILTDLNLYFGLGNLPAAFEDKRFIEEDLNRCFGKSDRGSLEAKRARELEELMLKECDFLLDLHQTVSPADGPFFIFQYASERCLGIMEKWNPGIPTILQEDQIGENTGLSTDEYMRSLGKFGTALELGQLGTDEHENLGYQICHNAILVTNSALNSVSGELTSLDFPVLRLNGAYKVKDSSYKLDAGWKNLKFMNQGERVGVYSKGVIEAPASGCMLFPRYRTLETGQELFYFCTLLNETAVRSNKIDLKSENKESFIQA